MIKQCTNCNSTNIEEVTENNFAVFYCYDCLKKSGAANVLDGKMVIKPFKDGIKHVTIGALIEKDGKYLLAKRRTFPYRFSFVAGHLENGELPRVAITREVFEEVGLKVKRTKLLFHGDIVGNKCRAGANTHEWYFFRTITNESEPVINNEFEFVNWYDIEQMKKLDLGFATRFLLDKTGLIPGINHE